VTATPRTPSRAPVAVVIAFFGVAITLVLIGAQRSLEPPPSPGVARAGSPESPRPVTVIMRDYLFEPTPLSLVPGETVRLTIFDAGLVAHELTLGDAAVQDAWDRADAAATPPGPLATAPAASAPGDVGGLRVLLRSGEHLAVDYTVPRDQELLLLCHLPGHIARGMIGRIELVTPAS
jgi:uncharacterized cupredoxin-like copper-binding protein